MGLLNRNFTRDWQHLRESGSGYDLSWATGGESAIRCWRLKCCPIDLRQSWFRSSTIIQQIELYVALCGTTFPKNFTTAVCCQQALPNLRLKSFLYSAQPASLLVFDSRHQFVTWITKNLYSVVRHCSTTNKTRTKIFVILAVPIKMSHWRQAHRVYKTRVLSRNDQRTRISGVIDSPACCRIYRRRRRFN